MSPVLDRRGIAARIRALLGEQHAGTLRATAQRLGVFERELRLSIDERSPHPALDVIAAIVSMYGVDPSWIMYGEYDSATHHEALAKGVRVSRLDLLMLVTRREQPRDSASIDPHLDD